MQSEGKIILIYSYFAEFRVYSHPYYNMTLGFKSMGLVVVLSYCLPLFLRKIFHVYAYTYTYAHVVITSPCHLTCWLVSVSYRYSIALCFHETSQLVVIISRLWDETNFLRFGGAVGGSTLFTLRSFCIMELPSCLNVCVYMGILSFVYAVRFTPWYNLKPMLL